MPSSRVQTLSCGCAPTSNRGLRRPGHLPPLSHTVSLYSSASCDLCPSPCCAIVLLFLSMTLAPPCALPFLALFPELYRRCGYRCNCHRLPRLWRPSRRPLQAHHAARAGGPDAAEPGAASQADARKRREVRGAEPLPPVCTPIAQPLFLPIQSEPARASPRAPNRHFIRQIGDAVRHLHVESISHRDIKVG